MQCWEFLSGSSSECEVADLIQKQECCCLSQGKGWIVPAVGSPQGIVWRVSSGLRGIAHSQCFQPKHSLSLLHSAVLAGKGAWTQGWQKSLLLLSLHLHCSLSPPSSRPSSCMCFRGGGGLMVHDASMLLRAGVGFRRKHCRLGFYVDNEHPSDRPLPALDYLVAQYL